MVLAENKLTLHDIHALRNGDKSTVISTGKLIKQINYLLGRSTIGWLTISSSFFIFFLLFSGQLEGKGSTKLTNGAWNPHQNCQQYATVNEHTVRGWDVRTMKQSWLISECFSTSVRAIDFNPNKQYQIATGIITELRARS